MVIKNPDTIKQIICSNFNKSAPLYEAFEKRYGLFKDLTIELAEASNIKKGMSVCDIGCGTGTSSHILAGQVGSEGRIIGIDFSEEMLSSAKNKLRHFSNVEFIQCDADELKENIDCKLDAILYNACIFLIPENKKTLQCAYELLEEGGIVGMNYLIGMFMEEKNNENRVDLFQWAKKQHLEFAPYGREIVDVNRLSDILGKVGFRDIRTGRISKTMSEEQVKDFYSIPAQSAGLYPKTPYEKRLKLLDSLLAYLHDRENLTFYQVWGWYTSVK